MKKCGTHLFEERKAQRPAKDKVSDKQKERNKLYSVQRKEYMKKHPWCQLRFFKVCTRIATTVHHIAKRGKNTNDMSTFRSACMECHNYLETVMSAKERRTLGLLVNDCTRTSTPTKSQVKILDGKRVETQARDLFRNHRTAERGAQSFEGQQEIEIPLTDAIRDIIVTLGNPDKHPSCFVFSIIDKNMGAEYQDAVIRQKIKITNKWLKSLCEANDLPGITTYWARHSYANLLKESGESVELIRELLGHSDIRTTETYLKRFDLNRRRKANDKIMGILKAS